jgi:hypothetical protein
MAGTRSSKLKTRSNGPWTVGEFFGLGKLNKESGLRSIRQQKANSKSQKSSIFSNLWGPTKKFGELRQELVFLLDVQLDSELQMLLDDSKGCQAPVALPPSSQVFFKSLLGALTPTDTSLNRGQRAVIQGSGIYCRTQSEPMILAHF